MAPRNRVSTAAHYGIEYDNGHATECASYLLCKELIMLAKETDFCKAFTLKVCYLFSQGSNKRKQYRAGEIENSKRKREKNGELKRFALEVIRIQFVY
ncbi:hypothetical protein TGAM01_v204712 [Trichoderma gamsii]|uniref:Uncharacterized protein n=1 Tax=Trichoderma gamsii TaxID=398673 RepID=A0A2P4ZPP4_9HYPO|nr:hypothetical protein TGAM01_v204712 [Trichoderma gamsii]PON26236.1 hypothetical protein TGAM01_v204712 [Trichoderma gamsii]